MCNAAVQRHHHLRAKLYRFVGGSKTDASADDMERDGCKSVVLLELTAGVATLSLPVEEAKTAYEQALPGRFS